MLDIYFGMNDGREISIGCIEFELSRVVENSASQLGINVASCKFPRHVYLFNLLLPARIQGNSALANMRTASAGHAFIRSTFRVLPFTWQIQFWVGGAELVVGFWRVATRFGMVGGLALPFTLAK